MKHKRFLSLLIPVILFHATGHGQQISLSQLKDKVAGAWIGQMVGNIYGLPFENKFIDEPGDEARFPFGYTKNMDKLAKYDGAFSDDDTDVEYLYLMGMEKYGIEPTYEQMRQLWMHHIRDRVWLANRAALGLMHYGYTPPFTGMQEYNPHWYQIDPQLINEIWGYTAPGMVDYAAAKSDWAARITSDSWAIEPTIMYGAMFAKAFFCNDIRKLIDEGLKYLPVNGRFARGVRKMIALHKQYPNSWQTARAKMAEEFYINEDPMTKTIWNANLNGCCAILAMLYGNGDFQRTLDLCCAMGFDCDNQAATISGLMGVMYGASSIPANLTKPIKGWSKPFNDRYINVTRYDMPDASIDDIINRTYRQAIKLSIAMGGKLKGNKLKINANAKFVIPLEFCTGPKPVLEQGQESKYSFTCCSNQAYHWKLVSGKLPNGIIFNRGQLSGIPEVPGHYPVKLSLSDGNHTLEKNFDILVKSPNIAPMADTIYTTVRKVNMNVLDSCWTTFGYPIYALDIKAINDGRTRGEHSVFYSLAAKSNNPKMDYFGYGWNKPHNIGMLTFNGGCLEEFGGWFSDLFVQYQDQDGHWRNVKGLSSSPKLPDTDIVFFQPHYASYILEFEPVMTRGIRIVFDDKVQTHWEKYTKNVSSFISVTEIEVHEAK